MLNYIKSFKKVISIMVVILLAFCIAFVYEESNKPVKVSLNEYLVLKELKNKSVSELQKMGFSAKDIEKINNFDYAEELYKRSKLDDSTLKNLGYTDKQISMLRNFSGTEKEIIPLAGYLDIWSYVNSYYYSKENNRTYFQVNFGWQWSTPPAFMGTDIIEFAWSEGMYIDLSPSKTYHRVQYVNSRYGYSYYENIDIEPKAPVGKAQTKFEMYRNLIPDPPISYEWAKSGYGSIQVSKLGRIPEIAMLIEYRHQTLLYLYRAGYDYIVESLIYWEN